MTKHVSNTKSNDLVAASLEKRAKSVVLPRATDQEFHNQTLSLALQNYCIFPSLSGAATSPDSWMLAPQDNRVMAARSYLPQPAASPPDPRVATEETWSKMGVLHQGYRVVKSAKSDRVNPGHNRIVP